MTEPYADSDSDAWQDLLRRMLPAGAPLPDDEQLDYSIAVEYKGPPLDFPVPVVDPLSSKTTLQKPPKYRKVPSVHSKFALRMTKNSSGSGSGSSSSASRLRNNSSSEFESKIPTDQSLSDLNNSGNVLTSDIDENDYEHDDDQYNTVARNEYNSPPSDYGDGKSLFPSAPGPSMFLVMGGEGTMTTSAEAIVAEGDVLFAPANTNITIATSSGLHLYRAGVNSRFFEE